MNIFMMYAAVQANRKRIENMSPEELKKEKEELDNFCNALYKFMKISAAVLLVLNMILIVVGIILS